MDNRRKLENAALALSVFGAILMVQPLLNLFNIEVRLFGMPLIIIYLFSVWIALIGGTFIISRLLAKNASKREQNIIENSETLDDKKGES